MSQNLKENGDKMFIMIKSSLTDATDFFSKLSKTGNIRENLDFNQLEKHTGNTFLLAALVQASEKPQQATYGIHLAEFFLDTDTDNVMTGKENSHGETPLICACKMEVAKDFVLRLLSKKRLCNPSSQEKETDNTALILACQHANWDKIILQIIQIVDMPSIELVNKETDTALTIACANPNIEEATILQIINTGFSNPGNLVTENKTESHNLCETALLYAIQSRKFDVAMKLIDTPDSNVETGIENAADGNPYTAYDVFREKIIPDFFANKQLSKKNLEIKEKVIQLLLKFVRYFYKNHDKIGELFNVYLDDLCDGFQLSSELEKEFGTEFIKDLCYKPVATKASMNAPLELLKPSILPTLDVERVEPLNPNTRNPHPYSRSPSPFVSLDSSEISYIDESHKLGRKRNLPQANKQVTASDGRAKSPDLEYDPVNGEYYDPRVLFDAPRVGDPLTGSVVRRKVDPHFVTGTWTYPDTGERYDPRNPREHGGGKHSLKKTRKPRKKRNPRNSHKTRNPRKRKTKKNGRFTPLKIINRQRYR